MEERPDAPPGYRHLVLALRQPNDHRRRDSRTFELRPTLLHTSADRVEHRYFGTSRPTAPGYPYLTIRYPRSPPTPTRW